MRAYGVRKTKYFAAVIFAFLIALLFNLCVTEVMAIEDFEANYIIEDCLYDDLFDSEACSACTAVPSPAECMVAIETGSNRILYQKNAYVRRPMASTTKILTAITAIENNADLNRIISVPDCAVGIEGSSIYLVKGEKIAVLDLLYALMLRSGNDCAVALAVVTAGSVENFAALMNKTAKKAGAKSSNFVNPHGLHDDNHYTTAYDLALITSYAMKNQVFKEISSAKSHRIKREKTDCETLLLNKNKLLHSLKGADGVKTGFTKRAGRCLVGSATRDDMQIVSVALNCGPMFEECARLIDRGFSEYSLTKVLSKGDVLCKTAVKFGKNERISLGIGEDFYYPLKSGENAKIDFSAPEFVNAPLCSGSAAGGVTVSINGSTVYKTELIALEDAIALNFADYIRLITSQW